MADIAMETSQNLPKNKRNNSRKALKQTTSSTNEANILAAAQIKQPSPTPPPSADDSSKENLSVPKKGKAASTKAAVSKGKQSSFEKELQEMQKMLERMKIEKEKTEELLKEKDEMLKTKEEELENKGKELKKLQKMKEFKPTMNFPIFKEKVEDKKDKKKKKKKADPEHKRPSTPYILWCKEQWNKIKLEKPEAEFKEISSLLGAKWKTVTAEEKKPYDEKYCTEKEAYLQVMNKEKRETEAMRLLEDENKQKTAMELLDQYLQFKQEAEKEDNKKTKKEKDPLKPKQPMSAFFLFSNERRAALLEQNKNVTEVAKISGEEWKNMTEKQKAPYEELAKKNKEKYLIEIEAYKQMKNEEASSLKKEEDEMMKVQKQEAMQLLKKKEKNKNIIKKTKEERQKKKGVKIAANPNKPKKPASSYLLFSKETRKTLQEEERQGMNSSTVNALLSVKWKELSEEERQVWNARAAEGMEAYKKELEEYNKSVGANTEDVESQK